MKRIDPAFVQAQIQALLARFPELEGDEELRADMIEAETDALELLSILVRKKAEADSFVVGIKSYEDTLSERRKRMERRSDAARELMFRIMEAAGLPKAELQEATLSIRAGTAKVIVTDEKALPAEFVKLTATPMKTEIAKAIKDGQQVPGAIFSNGEATLMVRMN